MSFKLPLIALHGKVLPKAPKVKAPPRKRKATPTPATSPLSSTSATKKKAKRTKSSVTSTAAAAAITPSPHNETRSTLISSLVSDLEDARETSQLLQLKLNEEISEFDRLKARIRELDGRV